MKNLREKLKNDSMGYSIYSIRFLSKKTREELLLPTMSYADILEIANDFFKDFVCEIELIKKLETEEFKNFVFGDFGKKTAYEKKMFKKLCMVLDNYNL